MPKDKPIIHKQKYPNRNGPGYIRKVGEFKDNEVHPNEVFENIVDEIGDFNVFNEEIAPQKPKKIEIPH